MEINYEKSQTQLSYEKIQRQITAMRKKGKPEREITNYVLKVVMQAINEATELLEASKKDN